MDFIDDFIQEYKNNPCLWKADSIDFKNRTKRQEAYLKLIDVAGKHGEHYNIERTKQKINNLRCAFRHQLKKYNEFKSKGEKDEAPYCPKRRYFESLMFLKDEENPDRKPKRATNLNSCIIYNPQDESAKVTDLGETSAYKDAVVELASNGTVDACKNNRSDVLVVLKERAIITSDTILEYDEEKPSQGTQESTDLSRNSEPPIYDYDKESSARPRKAGKCRKRSSSLSSQLSNETESIPPKTLKVDFTSLDVEKLISLALKSSHSNIDDHFSNIGKIIAHKLRSMDSKQAMFAEKIIVDVLFQGQMNLLTPPSINATFSADGSSACREVHTNK